MPSFEGPPWGLFVVSLHLPNNDEGPIPSLNQLCRRFVRQKRASFTHTWCRNPLIAWNYIEFPLASAKGMTNL